MGSVRAALGRGLSTGTPRPGVVTPTPARGRPPALRTPPGWEFRSESAGSSIPAGSEAAPPPSAHSMNVHNHPGPTPGHHAPTPPSLSTPGPARRQELAGVPGGGAAGMPEGPDGT